MNRSQEILDYLAANPLHRTVVLAPNAPPVAHSAGEVSIILNVVLSASDVVDTLMWFKGLTSRRDLGNPTAGTFSFGVRNVGRIRVLYLTQRGSKVVMVTRIPYDIPSLESVCVNAAAASKVTAAATAASGGIIAVSGPDREVDSTFVYGVLDELNRTQRQIIGVVEVSLSYLMSHRNSVVVQCDVGSDVETLQEGIASVLELDPKVLYVGGIRYAADVELCGCAIQPGRVVIAGSHLVDAGALLARLVAQMAPGMELGPESPKLAVRLGRELDGKVKVTLS